jgi:hypothetical protein
MHRDITTGLFVTSTYSLHSLCSCAPVILQMTGTLKVDGSGNVELQETDGIDYAATTVQLPGGERVPFLFTVKNLNAKGTLDAFGGEFVVPSYRGATFLDPKVRIFCGVLEGMNKCCTGHRGWVGWSPADVASCLGVPPLLAPAWGSSMGLGFSMPFAVGSSVE